MGRLQGTGRVALVHSNQMHRGRSFALNWPGSTSIAHGEQYICVGQAVRP